ncbi:Spo0J-like protein [Levilactobacillus senmaizukei DSM 21775 = NBRC 103853]|uniref:Spo0J-like protein n=1 Tax=Levilactobacillus senmaizukei DSM 21775 = NBRC 103853 TaxID=1423803 RepID=A0A0R2DR97_9LACO|nr:Spo0J-like protein [Levilactobacillus senmaizukei DSM 21775 = NBRC 103853]
MGVRSLPFSLFGNNRDKTNEPTHPVKQSVVMIPVGQIIPNRFQPRQRFDETAIGELAQTIAEHGLLQPIVLRQYEPDHYEIIAGERRFRAVSSLNWDTVPAIVETMDDDETASMALIENLQREELSAVEEAHAYQQLMALNHMTQAQLAEGIGKSQGFIANKLRLLKLAEPVRAAILNRKISERHGRAMLAVPADEQPEILEQVLADQLTVKETEALIAEAKAPAKPAKRRRKVTRHGVTGDTRVAVNTIRKSVKMVTDAGMKLETHEEETPDGYRIIIDIPKES